MTVPHTPNGHGPPEPIETRLLRVEGVLAVKPTRGPDGENMDAIAVVLAGLLSDFEVMQDGNNAFAMSTDFDPRVHLIAMIPNILIPDLIAEINQLLDTE